MISIICVYNNEQSLKNDLLRSLESQTSRHELILVDNTQGQFKSMARALNSAGTKATGKYLMFVHQDVDLCSGSWLEDAEIILDSIPSLGIAGVAGMSGEGHRNAQRGRNIIRHREDHRIWEWGNPIRKPEIVQTVDGCLIIIPKPVFDVLQFDEETCDDFHLYEVDYCLSSKKLGFDTYVIPMCIYHRSGSLSLEKSNIQAIKSFGGFPKAYYQTLGKLMKKHRDHFKRIYTTCGDWNTSHPVTLQRFEGLVKAMIGALLGKVIRKQRR